MLKVYLGKIFQVRYSLLGAVCPWETCQHPKYQHESVQKPQSALSGEDCGFLRPHKKMKGAKP